MKKATIMIIGIIYVASIVIISIFGLKSLGYIKIIPVTSIEFSYIENENITETTGSNGEKVIKIKYGEPGIEKPPSGTMLQFTPHVYPENASDKKVKYVFADVLNVDVLLPNGEVNKDARVKSIKNEDGTDLGLFLFTGKVIFTIEIKAIDGQGASTEVKVWVY